MIAHPTQSLTSDNSKKIVKSNFSPTQHSQINCQNNIRKSLINISNPDRLSVIDKTRLKLNNTAGFIINSGFPINNTAISRGEI